MMIRKGNVKSFEPVELVIETKEEFEILTYISKLVDTIPGTMRFNDRVGPKECKDFLNKLRNLLDEVQ